MRIGWFVLAIIVLIALMHFSTRPEVPLGGDLPAMPVSESAVFVRMVNGRK